MNNKNELKYKAFNFSITVVQYCGKLPRQNVFWIIADQLLRAATSIGANIVEAQAASSKKDFINYYQIALKSAYETRYWLAILRDGTNVEKNEVSKLIEEAVSLSNILGASLLTLKRKSRHP